MSGRNVERPGSEPTPEEKSGTGEPPPPLTFFRAFLRSPLELGTCFGSSPALSRAMVADMGLESAAAVAELGPGTGPLTEQILARIPRGCRFVAVERNADLAAALRRRWPDLHVHQDDAANLVAICRREGIEPGSVDAVISSLPFLLMPAAAQSTLLHAAAAVLRPGGRFCAVTYRPEAIMPSVKRFRSLMEREFSRVRLAKVVLANVPPAFVYRCIR